jgi:hypothetical protein
MKKLMMLALVAVLSFGVASVSWAQEPTPKAEKHHKKHKAKKSKKSKEPTPAAQ